MSTEFIALPEDLTVREAISYLKTKKKIEKIFYIYVVDKDNILVGVVSLKQLILAPDETKLKDIMIRDIIKVSYDTPQEEVGTIVSKYDLLAVPVVNEKGQLIGIITIDNVIDIITEEALDDFYKIAGTSKEEVVYGDDILKIAKFRLPWLITNFIGGLITGAILYAFKNTIKEVIALTSFVPVIMGMGGNVGTQSSSITVRGLATGKIILGKVIPVLYKEVRVGAVMGLVCGSLVGIVGGLWKLEPILGFVVGLSMFFAMTVASAVGVIMPVLFKKLNIDPAIASGPFVTTSNDITGLSIYMFMATLLLKFLK